jgi:hypothetical protein
MSRVTVSVLEKINCDELSDYIFTINSSKNFMAGRCSD